MIGIIYSTKDKVSVSAANYIQNEYGFKDRNGLLVNDKITLKEIDTEPIYAEEVDRLGFRVIFFLSKHSSAKGIPAFTTHSTGNWTAKAEFGGKPKELSVAAPLSMLSAIANLERIGGPIEKSYEATHHGPLLKTPSLFVEVGGNEETMQNKVFQEQLAKAVYEAAIKAADNDINATKVAIGISGTHYPIKFTRLALEKGYAFSHIMPKYAIMNDDGSDNLDVLEQTLKRTTDPPEVAIIEWKSVNAMIRNKILSKLNEIGLDYERI